VTRSSHVSSPSSTKPKCDSPAPPEIRFRYTPAAGLVYGAKPDDVIPPERVLYDPDRGTWFGYEENDGKDTPVQLQTIPASIFAQDANGFSLGYLDDECDGIVSVALAVGGKMLEAFARIGAGPRPSPPMPSRSAPLPTNWPKPPSASAAIRPLRSSMPKSEVAPVWWTPRSFRERCSSCRRPVLPTPLNFAGRWSSWSEPGVIRPI
jgi:hypothetical protein